MPDTQIFKATYSGIPVYEMMCKGVAVMRRRSDSWLNATQILKVAGFDKPQRTRILEREIQKGEHEKVQGGYGKYQGTWIPLSKGLHLCQQYNCEHLLRPLIDFQPDASDTSPPLAPKHLVAAPSHTKPNSRKGENGTPTMSTRSAKKAVVRAGDHSEVETLSAKGSADGSMTPSPSEASSSSRTPSPIRSSPSPRLHPVSLATEYHSPSPPSSRKRKHRHSALAMDIDGAPDRLNGPVEEISYGDQILEYFISDTNQIPQVLINPPHDFDPNLAIDDDGHTALHWASAMGRIRVVKLLLTAGADIFKVNKAGQTALMRSVMFANNYDVRKFPELYELLHRSTLNIDNSNRTVFHHIVDVAMSKGKSHAARYYMETVLSRLSDYPQELADIINFQDEDGETALTLAARCRSKRLVKLLLDYGANPKIANKDGKNTEDYILEDERFRSSPIIPSRTMAMSFRNAQAANPPPSSAALPYTSAPANSERPPLHYSATGQKAATRVVNDVTALLDSLAAAYDQELKDKERDMNQASALLLNIQTEILDSQRTVNSLRNQSQGLEEVKTTQTGLENELRVKLGKRQRLGWEKWVMDEEERERTIQEASGGHIIPASSENGVHRAANGEDITDILELHTDIPNDPDVIRQQCVALRSEIVAHKKRRLETFDELVRAQAESGTGGKMSEYRRLIGAGCGGVPPGEVDNVVTMLLETLESEDSSASSTTWNGSATSKPPTTTGA
ncbi:apses-domain-containing protein [Irpex rosettiformis]|uniref:Apses-domain-containing protein n=1 Tax=Irpex rosettiformis TaxID=378272 RepID=A0ACB8UCI6_9APHY|nr:apses-domain-containing protein [Irpex rosettiformis]